MQQSHARWLAALALVCFVVAPALADQKTQTQTHEGTVVSVSGDKLTMRDNDGKEMTHTLARDAKVMCDGKECQLSDLKPGMRIWVTTPADNANQATLVKAETRATNQANQNNPNNQTGRAYLGIMAESAANGEGVTIRNVDPNGAAAKAGLQPGDMIRKVGDRDVRDFDQLVNALAQHRPNDKVTLHVRRAGKDQDFEVTLGRRPESPSGQPITPNAPRPTAFLGVATVPLTQEEKDRLGVPTVQGVRVVEVVPGTPAEKAGLQRDDIITSFNDTQITSPQQLWQAVQQAGADKEVTVKAMRGKENKEFKAHLEQAPADFYTPPRR